MERTTRYAEIRSSELSVSERFPRLGEMLDELGRISDAQYDALLSVLGTGLLYTQDLLLLSLISRSLELIDGFASAVDGWRISVASALVRLEVDTLLRAHLGAITPDPDALVFHLADDQPLHRLKLPTSLRDSLSGSGLDTRKFSDAVLVALAARELPWVPDVYKTASSWVHHSASHMFTTWKIEGGTFFSARVPVDIDQFDEDFLGPLIVAMTAPASALVTYLNMWEQRKATSPGSSPINGAGETPIV
jgi:hypothetical protein